MSRDPLEHQTLGVQRLAVRSEDYWEYRPEQRVQTCDGFPGTVTAVSDGFHSGGEEYQVTLDGGMGGGTYTASQLSPAPSVTAAAGTAGADYPELAQVLVDRPDPARHQIYASGKPPWVKDDDSDDDDEDSGKGSSDDSDSDDSDDDDDGSGKSDKDPDDDGDDDSGKDSDNDDDSDDDSDKDDSDNAPPWAKKASLFDSLIRTAAVDADFRFHVTSAWRDVVAKAKRIRSEGGVRVTLASDGILFAEVKGDNDVYEAGLQRLPGKTAAQSWSCGCKWGAYHWGADDDFSRFAGRMCSHALALQYEAQSRGMFGRDINADEERPAWVPRKVVIRYDIDSGQNQLVRSSALAASQEMPTGAPLQALARAAVAAGEDREEVLLALSVAGVTASSWDDYHEDENGRRYTLDEDGEPSYSCHNKYCDEGGEHGGDGETAQRHDDVYTDWDTVHPHLGEHLHRGMAVDLPDHVHSVVHDDSRPVEERAHALADHLKDRGLGTHWTPNHDQAKHYTGVSDGRDHDTHVVVHAHTPDKEHIETDPDELADQDVIAMGDHDDAEVPLKSGAQVNLKGISWKHRTDKKWTRHDFPGGMKHEASVNSPFGEPSSGTSYQLPHAPGATKPRRANDNPASSGPFIGADPVGWQSELPTGSLGDRLGAADHSLFEPGGAEADLHDEPEGALPATDGVSIPDDDEALTPSMTASLSKRAMADFSHAEQQELINEGEGVKAANLDRLQIEGTHYAELEHVLAAADDDTTWMA